MNLGQSWGSLSKKRTPVPSTSLLTSEAIPNLPAQASTITTGFSALANRAVISATTYSVTSSDDAAVVLSEVTDEMALISCAAEGGGRDAAVDSGGGAECG